MLTSNQIRNIQNEFNSSRTLLGNQTWQIVKGLEGEIFEESFATRVVDVSPTNLRPMFKQSEIWKSLS